MQTKALYTRPLKSFLIYRTYDTELCGDFLHASDLIAFVKDKYDLNILQHKGMKIKVQSPHSSAVRAFCR